MTTYDRRTARRCTLACLILLLLGMAGCQPAPVPAPTATSVPPTVTPAPTATAVPRLPISAADVQAIAAPFDKVSKGYIAAWNTHDVENMRPLLTDDVLYYEPDNNPMESTAIGLLGTNWQVLHDSPNLQGRQVSMFINRGSAFAIWEMWNYAEDVLPSSPEDPIRGYNWYTLRDGKIATMWLFWEPEFMVANAGTDSGGAQYHEEVLQGYEQAWSSGDPQAVAALYAPDAARHDALFGDDQAGAPAIQKSAARFFASYPGARFERIQSFQLALSMPVKVGGVYVIHALNQARQPCDVRAIILLEAPILDDLSAGKLINEWLFYEPDSLIACGWAA